MELSDELLEQIGAYLAGQLSAEEKARFEARVQQDAGLRNEVALQRQLKQGLSFLAQKNRFRSLHTDLEKRGLLEEAQPSTSEVEGTKPYSTEPKVISFPARQSVFQTGWARWAMAASLALLLGLGWGTFQNRRLNQAELARNEQTFNSFFSATPKPAPVLSTDPDRVAASPEVPQTASDSARLYEAIGTLQQAEWTSAIPPLRSLSSGQPGHWRASAQWYLALAYLRNQQRTEARTLLASAARLNGHPYQREARQLLDQLPPVQP